MWTLPLQILTQLCFNENEAVTLPRKRILVSLKILTQITVEDENEMAEREVFPKTINERILQQ